MSTTERSGLFIMLLGIGMAIMNYPLDQTQYWIATAVLMIGYFAGLIGRSREGLKK